jgi:hypothetical protein
MCHDLSASLNGSLTEKSVSNDRWKQGCQHIMNTFQPLVAMLAIGCQLVGVVLLFKSKIRVGASLFAAGLIMELFIYLS